MNKVKNNFSFLVIIFMALSMICCSEKNSDTDESDKLNKKLEGKWTLKSGASYAIKDNGEQIVTATLKPGVVTYDFKADGIFIGYDNVQSLSEAGTWKLENVTTNSDGTSGKLAIQTPSTIALKSEIFVDSDGYHRFSFSISNKTLDVMNLISKRYEAYPYKENWVEYLYTRN